MVVVANDLTTVFKGRTDNGGNLGMVDWAGDDSEGEV